MINKYKILLKNTSIFAVSNFATKFLNFFMLPLYTRAMTRNDFGLVDLIINMMMLLVPLLTLCASDGALRFAMEKEYNKAQVFMFGIKIVVLSTIISACLYYFYIIDGGTKEFALIFLVLYIVTAFNNYFGYFIRGIGNVKLIGIVGIISSISLLLLVLGFLLKFRLGIKGFLFAHIFMNIISLMTLFLYGKLYKYFNLKTVDKILQYEILKYNLPLVINYVGWWIIMISDRYIVNWFCGSEVVGVLAVANRIPMIIATIYGVFQQALLLSVIKEFKEFGSEVFIERIYKFVNLLLLTCASSLIFIIKPISSFLFGETFFDAWQLVPFLVVSEVFRSLYIFYSNIFIAVKKTKSLLVCAIIGMIFVLSFNMFLVPRIGAIGTGISASVTYMVIWLVLVYISKYYVHIKINFMQDLVCYFILIGQSLVAVLYNGAYINLVSLMALVSIVFIKRIEIIFFMDVIYKKVKGENI